MNTYNEVDCSYHRMKNTDLAEADNEIYHEALTELSYWATIWDVQSLIKKHGWEQVKKDIMKC